MAAGVTNVKRSGPISEIVARVRSWIDRRPRTGWYFALLLALNYALDALLHLL